MRLFSPSHNILLVPRPGISLLSDTWCSETLLVLGSFCSSFPFIMPSTDAESETPPFIGEGASEAVGPVGTAAQVSAAARVSAAATSVLRGGPHVVESLGDEVVCNLIYKLITFQGWLSRFSETQVRGSFLAGHFKVPKYGRDMLRSLDIIQSMMLPAPSEKGFATVPPTALAGVDFFTKFLKKSEDEPLDLAGNPLPVRMSYKAWSIFLGQLSASSYWCVQELAKDTSVRPKEFPPCVLPPKSKTGVYLGDEQRVHHLPASAPHLPKRVPSPLSAI